MRHVRRVLLAAVLTVFAAQAWAGPGGGPTPPPGVAPRPGLTFGYGPGVLTGGQIAWQGIPTAMTCYLNAGNGAVGIASAAATATANFAVSYIRSGTTTSIGTVSWASTATAPTFPNVSVALHAGDIVEAIAPSLPDATLADAMFGIPCVQSQ